MRVAYFDNKGSLLIIMEATTNIVSAPDYAEYYAEISDDSLSANDLFYDTINQVVKQKTLMGLIVEGNKVSNVPLGSEVIFNDEIYLVNDGEVELDSNLDAYVTMYVQHPHYETSIINVWAGS